MFCTARTVLAVQLGPPTGAQSALLYTRNSPTCASTTVLAFWHRLQVVCAGTPARSALWQAIGWLHAWMHVYLNLINILNISGGAADRIKKDRSTYRKAAPVSTKAPIANPLQHTRSSAQLLSCGHKLPQVVQYSPVLYRSTALYTQRYAAKLWRGSL